MAYLFIFLTIFFFFEKQQFFIFMRSYLPFFLLFMSTLKNLCLIQSYKAFIIYFHLVAWHSFINYVYDTFLLNFCVWSEVRVKISLFSICISSDSRIICRDFLLPIELVLQLWSSFSKFVLVILSSLYHHFSFSTNLSNSRTKLALSWLCWLGRLVWGVLTL